MFQECHNIQALTSTLQFSMIAIDNWKTQLGGRLYDVEKWESITASNEHSINVAKLIVTER